MAPEISKYCCGVSLKTGTIIIGVLQSILSFMFLVLSAAYAENPHELIDMSDPSIVPNLQVLRSILIIISVGNALQCIFSIMIIFGALSNRPLMLLPWLVLNPISIAIYILGTIVGAVHHSPVNNVGFIVGHLLIGSIVCLVGGYNILTVHSFYKYLKMLNF